jgi:LAS superfamily LD-carboxypeptidase LdcB
VNQDFRLASSFAPNDMRVVNVRSVNGTHRMRRTAAGYAENLFQDARRSGHTLIATSGFRSYATQRATHNHWISVLGLTQARRVSARPGHSEHQLGLALDISTPRLGGALSASFSSTSEGRWLRNNAHRYGFIIRYPRNREADTGFAYEPWHIRFVGVDAATEIFNRGLILEEFLGH